MTRPTLPSHDERDRAQYTSAATAVTSTTDSATVQLAVGVYRVASEGATCWIRQGGAAVTTQAPSGGASGVPVNPNRPPMPLAVTGSGDDHIAHVTSSGTATLVIWAPA